MRSQETGSDPLITKLRLKKTLEHAVEGEPEYWYGVVDGFSGSLGDSLFTWKPDAARVAKRLEGYVVIVAARILEDSDGDHIEPEN